jgi:CheY-like chemotaxis protein/HPt (histidine-containing phosphotransfer) domain-containing protein
MLEACSVALGHAVDSDSRASQREESLHRHQVHVNGAHLLLVEDNAFNQELAVDVLLAAGVAVTVASNGREALELLDVTRFDAVLMDCQMPVMDGYAATRALRQRPEFADLPVIAMTANAMVGDREKALAAGMNDHVAKPIDVDELFSAIARWVQPAPGGAPVLAAPAISTGDWQMKGTLPGIDITVGRARTKGDERLYRRLLDIFLDGQREFVTQFRAASATGDIAAAARLAHDLKSLAATIGADTVQTAAASLENACTEQGSDMTPEVLLEATAHELRIVIDGLQARRDEATSDTAA